MCKNVNDRSEISNNGREERFRLWNFCLLYRHKPSTGQAGQSGQTGRRQANRRISIDSRQATNKPVGPREIPRLVPLLAPCRSSGGVGCSSETAGHSTNGPTATFRFAALSVEPSVSSPSFLLKRFRLTLLSLTLLRGIFYGATTTMRFVTRQSRTRILRMRVIGRAFSVFSITGENESVRGRECRETKRIERGSR